MRQESAEKEGDGESGREGDVWSELDGKGEKAGRKGVGRCAEVSMW